MGPQPGRRNRRAHAVVTILIDPPIWQWQGRGWSHMVSDQGLDDLHGFSRQVPLRYLSFGIDHYDVPEELYDRAISLGAEPADGRTLVRVLREQGLRRNRGKLARTWKSRPWQPEEFAQDIADRAVELAQRVDAGSEPRVFHRPDTTVIMVEGETEPFARVTDSAPAAPAHRENEVVTRWGRLWSVELVIGEF